MPVSFTVAIGGQETADHMSQCLVTGVMRIAATVPSGITPGNAVAEIVHVGNAASQSGVTIAVAGK